MADLMENSFKLVVLSIIVGLAYVKGFDTGYDEGMKTGQIRELVNQGYTIEDAKEIADSRERMMTTVNEIL